MMKRFFSVLLALTTTTVISGTTFAIEQQTDEYGNVIDWDTNGYGFEDNAGLEESEDNADQSETAATYSFQEQAVVFSQMEAVETEAPGETGLLTVSLCDVPDDWSQNNIKLSLYRGNVKEDIFLYRQSAWSESTQLPIGHYTVYEAKTLDGKEIFHSDINSFDITEESAVNLTLSYGELEKIVPNVRAQGPILSNQNSEDTKEVKTKSAKSLIPVGIVLVIGFMAFCWFKKLHGKECRSNNHSVLD
jgi:hypothetical protein